MRFWSVSAHLFHLSLKCWYVHIHMVVQSNDHIIQCLYMDIYLYLQWDNFWEVCVVMTKYIWVWNKI